MKLFYDLIFSLFQFKQILQPLSEVEEDSENQKSKLFLKLEKKKDENLKTLIENINKESEDGNSIKNIGCLLSAIKADVVEAFESHETIETNAVGKVMLSPSDEILLELQDGILDEIELRKEKIGLQEI